MADFHQIIARMREIATQSGNALLLADGPVHPDTALLDLCAEIMHLQHDADQADRAVRAFVDGIGRRLTIEERAQADAMERTWHSLNTQASPLLRRAGKMRAVTAAGIFAKALLIHGSCTGAKTLAKSLAQDLVSSATLRASLWPAEVPVREVP